MCVCNYHKFTALFMACFSIIPMEKHMLPSLNLVMDTSNFHGMMIQNTEND